MLRVRVYDNKMSVTSEWLSFFVGAGIPKVAATNYAIIFTDNRISKDMLLDLNKEYLIDMGIDLMGDIISILKHAKAVHSQLSRDKVLQSKTKKVSVNSSQRSTPASRTVAHYLPKSDDMGPMNSPGVGISEDLSARLEAAVESDKAAVKTIGKQVALKKKRKVTAPTGDYVVPPAASSAAVTSTSAAANAGNKSVFDRLGQSTNGSVTSSDAVVSSSSQDKISKGSNVFARLGPERTAVTLSATSTIQDTSDAMDIDDTPCIYAGVLKKPAGQSKARIPVTAPMASPIIQVTVPKKMKLTSTKTVLGQQRAQLSAKSEGILSSDLHKPKSAKQRLGVPAPENAVAKKKITITRSTSGPIRITSSSTAQRSSANEISKNMQIAGGQRITISRNLKDPGGRKTITFTKTAGKAPLPCSSPVGLSRTIKGDTGIHRATLRTLVSGGITKKNTIRLKPGNVKGRLGIRATTKNANVFRRLGITY